MAYKVTAEFDINTGNSLQATDAVSKGMQDAANNTVSLKKELREMQQQLATLDPNSKAFQELSVRAGEVKDKINDASEAVRANAGNAFEGLANNTGLLTDRLMNLDFEGVASAARGMASSVGRIDFKTLSAGIQQAGASFASLGKALLTNPIFLIAASLALIVSYWGDIKAAAVSVSAEEERNLAIKRAKAEASKKELDNLKMQDNTLKLQGKTEKEILTFKLIKAKQTIQETKLSLEGEIAKRKAQEATERKFYDATKAFIAWTNAPLTILLDVVDAVLMGLNYIGLIADDTYQAIGDLSNQTLDWATKFLFNPDETAANNAKFIEEQNTLLTQLDNEAAGYELALQDIDKNITNNKSKELKTQVDKAETAAQDIQKIQEEQYQKQLDQFDKEARQIDERYADLKIKAQGNKEELAALEVLYQAEIADLNKRQAAEIQKQEEANLAARIKANEEANAVIRATYDAQEKLRIESMQEGVDKELALLALKYDEEIAAAEGNAELQKQITEKYVAAQTAIENKAREEKRKKDEEDRQAAIKAIEDNLNLATQGFSALSALGDVYFANRKNKLAGDEKASKALAEKQFKFNKKMQLAGAIIDAGKAITASLAASPVAIGPVPNPAGIASLAFASVTSAANIAKILATKFDSTGGAAGSTTPSISGGGGNEGGAPQFNPLASAFINNRPGQTGPTPAYVLAGDVTSAQEARNKVQDLARL